MDLLRSSCHGGQLRTRSKTEQSTVFTWYKNDYNNYSHLERIPNCSSLKKICIYFINIFNFLSLYFLNADD